LGQLGVRVSKTGLVYTEAPTPATGDNSTKIATTAYCVNMRCTTNATTTSSASTTRPCWVVQNYLNGTSWYRIWSDGWCEQGGRTPAQESTKYEVTLLKAFKNTDYTVAVADRYTSNTNNGWGHAHSYTTTSFKIAQTSQGCSWLACGYIA
jgi:hypothetical protein